MPRIVRNFWVAGDVDGRRSPLSGGPQGRDGGLSLMLYQRTEGQVAASLRSALLRIQRRDTLSGS